LLRGAPSMTVCATNHAFRNLGRYFTPRARRPQHHRDVSKFLASLNMVEIQHDRIGFAAVHTGVGAEIQEDTVL
jgi:hypothetical protein